jgi:secreted trypsin-like serine protease
VVIAALLALGFAVPSANSASPGPMIVEGDPAEDGEYPAQAFLEVDLGGGGGWSCGGTLVAPTKILSAAHCTTDDFDDEVPASAVTVYLGENDRSDFGASHAHAVSDVDVHGSYDSFTLENDVAMLTLSGPASQQPLRMIGADETAKWAPGVNATIVGWGTTEFGGRASDALLEAEVPIVSDADCDDAYATAFDPATMVCAYDGVHDTCQGDSGGPLMVPDGGSLVLAGITSWGEGCAWDGFPGVYTRIGAPALNDWIHDRLPATPGSPTAEAGGPYTVPEGGATTLSGSGTNPGGGSVTLSWDFDLNGVYETPGSSPTFSAATIDGPRDVAVRVQACNASSVCSIDTAGIHVTNVAPTVNAGGNRSGSAGELVHFEGSFTDPAPADTHTVAWSFGDGGTGNTLTADHAYAAPGIYVATLTVTDDNGGSSSSSAQVVIAAAAPPPPAPLPPAPPAPPPPPPPPPVEQPQPVPRVVRCVVPRLKGRTLAGARTALTRAHCRLGRVTRAYSSRVRAGRVVLQRPVAGRRLARGTRVTVVVSRGRRR